MQDSAVPHSKVLAAQGKSSLHGNNHDSNQLKDMNAPRLNQKANLTCYKNREKGIQQLILNWSSYVSSYKPLTFPNYNC